MTLGSALIVGVGPGLGLALARTFADAGHPVALFARDAARLAGYVSQLDQSGGIARAYPADAADPVSLRGALQTAVDDLGAPDALVYNAAVRRADTPTDGDDQGWADALAVDVLGAKIAAETVLPALREGRGSLLFTGGGLGLQPSPQYASLSVGKAGLRAYVQALHAQLAGTGVHVTSITITGKIGGGEERFDPAVLAAAYLDLHHQPDTDWRDELLRD